MGTPIAYLRRSRVYAGSPGAVSHEDQTRAVHALAAASGYTLRDGDVLEDWGRSGGAGKERHRPAYLILRDRIAGGTVTDVFAYDLSRLTRSTVEWAHLAETCVEHGVTIHTRDQTIDFGGWMGRMIATILAAIAQAERERASERSTAGVAYRRDNHLPLGAPRYGSAEGEDPAAVVAAFREAGSYTGAARLLNDRGIPPKSAGLTTSEKHTARPYRPHDPTYGAAPAWRGSVVRRIVQREAPDLAPRNPRAGSKSVQSWRFANLLRCHCGGVMTGQARSGGAGVVYRCGRSYTVTGHGAPRNVSEAYILPWVREEVARLTLPDRVTVGEDAAARSTLAGRLDRANELYIAGTIDRARYDAEAAAVSSGLDRLAAVGFIVDVPAIDWTWEPADVNRILRAIFDRIDLGPDLRPVRAEWTVPEWRS